MSPNRKLFIAACLASSLCACGDGGPSDVEIASALQARFQDFHGSQLFSSKKQKCTAVQAPAKYDCAVELEVQMEGTPKLKGVTHLTMVKNGAAWTIEGVFQMPATQVP
jgi:hypothetical protein